MTTYQSFETERLILRPTHIEDAAFVLDLLNSPQWIEYIGDRNVKSLEDASNYIKEKMLPQLERLGYGNYTIIRKEDGAKLGSCGLYDREGLEGLDIGFALLPAYYQKGYGYEAARKIMDSAIHVFNIKIIGGITVKENIASQKLLEKLGLKFIKIINLPNDPEDLLFYQLKVSHL